MQHPLHPPILTHTHTRTHTHPWDILNKEFFLWWSICTGVKRSRDCVVSRRPQPRLSKAEQADTWNILNATTNQHTSPRPSLSEQSQFEMARTRMGNRIGSCAHKWVTLVSSNSLSWNKARTGAISNIYWESRARRTAYNNVLNTMKSFMVAFQNWIWLPVKETHRKLKTTNSESPFAQFTELAKKFSHSCVHLTRLQNKWKLLTQWSRRRNRRSAWTGTPEQCCGPFATQGFCSRRARCAHPSTGSVRVLHSC